MTIPHAAIRSALRRLWWFGPQRREALKRAKIAPGIWLCRGCGKGHRKVDVDHIDAVGKTPGARGSTKAESWDLLIRRLFVDQDGLRVLCKLCHEVRTAQDRHSDMQKSILVSENQTGIHPARQA